MRVRLALLTLLMAGATLAPPVAADPDPRLAIGVRMSAPANCPEPVAFTTRVLARTPRARLDPLSPTRTLLEVQIDVSGSRFVGELRVRAAEGPEARRAVDAETCLELVDALALIAALAIDPDASTAPLSDSVLAAVAVDAVPEPPPPEPLDPSPSAPPVAPATRTETPPPLPASAATPSPKPPPDRARWSVAALFEVAGAPAPAALPAGRALVAITAPAWPGEPSTALSLAVGGTRVDRSFGDAVLTWVAGRVDLCPLDLFAGPARALRPCAAVDAGLLRGAGEAAMQPVQGLQTVDLVWASAVALGSFEQQLVGPLGLRLDAALVFPFLSEAGFVFQQPTGSRTILDIPPVSYALATGLVVTW